MVRFTVRKQQMAKSNSTAEYNTEFVGGEVKSRCLWGLGEGSDHTLLAVVVNVLFE